MRPELLSCGAASLEGAPASNSSSSKPRVLAAGSSREPKPRALAAGPGRGFKPRALAAGPGRGPKPRAQAAGNVSPGLAAGRPDC